VTRKSFLPQSKSLRNASAKYSQSPNPKREHKKRREYFSVISNEETIHLARKVNELLKPYMAVQENLFRPSLRKILRFPGVYRPVDYAANGDILRKLLEELTEVKSAIRRDLPAVSPGEEKFLGVLRGYVSLMTSAVAKLLEICGRLGERSRGGSYGREEYRGDMTSLREVQKKHLDAGLKLNAMMKEIASKQSEEDEEK